MDIGGNGGGETKKKKRQKKKNKSRRSLETSEVNRDNRAQSSPPILPISVAADPENDRSVNSETLKIEPDSTSANTNRTSEGSVACPLHLLENTVFYPIKFRAFPLKVYTIKRNA